MFNMLALAKGAKVEVAGLSASKKNEALEFMAKALLGGYILKVQMMHTP